MITLCGDDDHAGHSALTSVLWAKLKYNFHGMTHLSSGQQHLALNFLPTSPQTLPPATFRKAVI